MKKEKWYKFLFSDGTVVFYRGCNRQELKAAEREHRKLISKERLYV